MVIPIPSFAFTKLIPLADRTLLRMAGTRQTRSMSSRRACPDIAFLRGENGQRGDCVGFGDLIGARLMTDELGYEKFGAHGGDWGSTVTEHLARSHAGSVVGIHLTDVPFLARLPEATERPSSR